MTDPGLFYSHREPFSTPTPAIFFDRDGVLVEDANYAHRVEDLHIIPAAAPAINLAHLHNRAVVVVTNQAGIARGYYQWHDFFAFQNTLTAHLRASGAFFDGIWACGYHREGNPPLNQDHPWRKPHPGMIHHAARTLNLDLADSWLIGDKLIDIQAAITAGLRGAILVRTGYGIEMESSLRTLPATACQIAVADDAEHAVKLILASPRV